MYQSCFLTYPGVGTGEVLPAAAQGDVAVGCPHTTPSPQQPCSWFRVQFAQLRQDSNPEPQSELLSGLLLSQKWKNVQVLWSGRWPVGFLRDSTPTGWENKSSPGLGPDLPLRHGKNDYFTFLGVIFLIFKKELTISVLPNQIVYLHQPGNTRGEEKRPDVLATLRVLSFQRGKLCHTRSILGVLYGICYCPSTQKRPIQKSCHGSELEPELINIPQQGYVKAWQWVSVWPGCHVGYWWWPCS